MNNYLISKLLTVTTATVAGFSLFFGSVNASLIGDNVQGTLNFDGQGSQNFFDVGTGSSPVSATVVDPGVEFMTHFSGDPIKLSADLAGDTLSIMLENNLSSTVSLPGFSVILEDLDWVGANGEIIGLIPEGGNTLFETDLGFGSDTIKLDFDALRLRGRRSVFANYTIVTRHIDVPEPSTYLLLGTMCAFALMATKRKKARQK